METAFVSIICIALMVIGGMTMSRGFLSSMDNTSANIEADQPAERRDNADQYPGADRQPDFGRYPGSEPAKYRADQAGQL